MGKVTQGHLLLAGRGQLGPHCLWLAGGPFLPEGVVSRGPECQEHWGDLQGRAGWASSGCRAEMGLAQVPGPHSLLWPSASFSLSPALPEHTRKLPGHNMEPHCPISCSEGSCCWEGRKEGRPEAWPRAQCRG